MENIRPIPGLRVWISGAARGIGRSLVEHLTAQKCDGIAIADVLPKSEGDKLLAHLSNIARENSSRTKLIYYNLDIRDKISVNDSLQDAFKKLGGLNTIVNNAGVAEENNIYRAMGINAIAHICVTELVLKLFSGSNLEGKFPKMILNMSSAAGIFALPMHEYYTASKHALVGYSRSVAPRALKENIHVICVCPTWVSSGMGDQFDEHGAVAKSGVEVMDVGVLIRLLVLILESTDLAGRVVYLSPKTGARLADVSLRKSLKRTSKL